MRAHVHQRQLLTVRRRSASQACDHYHNSARPPQSRLPIDVGRDGHEERVFRTARTRRLRYPLCLEAANQQWRLVAVSAADSLPQDRDLAAYLRHIICSCYQQPCMRG